MLVDDPILPGRRQAKSRKAAGIRTQALERCCRSHETLEKLDVDCSGQRGTPSFEDGLETPFGPTLRARRGFSREKRKGFMSTYFDTSYLVHGTAAEIQTALAAIHAIQAEYACLADMQDEPTIDPVSSCLTWHCYCRGGMEEYNGEFANLTRGNAMSIWVYEGSTDGCCWGGIASIANGEVEVIDQFEADIGLRSAVASIHLAVAPDVDAALTLVDRIRIARGDGWDEEDWAHLRAGGVSAVLLANALSKHPELMASKPLSAALKRVGAGLKDIREDVALYDALEDGSLDKIDGLLAIIEGLEIANHIKPSKPSKPTKNTSARL